MSLKSDFRSKQTYSWWEFKWIFKFAKNLFKAIPEQLISKYLSSKVQYGIYLVFYFGDKEKNRKNMIENIEKSVPSKYDNNIKIVVIDLSKENT